MNDEKNRQPPVGARRFDDSALESDDVLWDLLGQAQRPLVSPFFSRNVLREIREKPKAWQRLLKLRWRFVPAAVMLAFLTCISVSQMMERPLKAPSAKRLADNKEYEVISNLDTLLAAEESSLWLEDSDQ